MADVELVQQLAALVRQERKVSAELAAKPLRDVRRVDRDRDDAGLRIAYPLLEFLELPELTRAKRSPRTPVEEIEHGFAQELFRIYMAAARVGKLEARKPVPLGHA